MVEVQYSKQFLSQYKKLSPTLKEKVKISIEKFKTDPRDTSLHVHKLGGKLQNYLSFSVDNKHRIVFEFTEEKDTVNLLKVGDHDVYR